MSVRDLITGYLLGDDGGEIRYYDKTFHEVLENTEIFLEKTLDSVYSVKFGIWTQQGKYGNFETWTGISDINELFGFNNTGGTVKFCGILEYSRFTVTPVYIVYKNNVPIYAMPDSDIPSVSLTPDIATVRYRYSDETEKGAFYEYKSDYSIDNIEMNGTGSLVIDTEEFRKNGVIYNVPSRFFAAGARFTVTYSYQGYTDMDGGTDHPRIVPSGGRVTRTATITCSPQTQSGICGMNYQYQNSVYTDLTNDDLFREFQNVYNAELTALGFQTYPVEILSPSS